MGLHRGGRGSRGGHGAAVNIKAFFVAALQSALDNEMATCEDVVRHVTPDVLAEHLPRPLWARLLTAFLGAPRVDATLVVETIGIPNFCEHIPAPIIWACLADIGSRSLGGYVPPVVAAPIVATPAPAARTLPATPLTAPPPDIIAPTTVVSASPPVTLPPVAAPPSLDLEVGLNDLVNELNADEKPAPARPRPPGSQRFRPSNTGIGRLAQPTTTARKSQAQAPVPEPLTAVTPERPRTSPRRPATEVSDYEVETDVGNTKDDWKNALAVEDEQLVDWSSSEETVTSGDDFHNGRRK